MAMTINDLVEQAKNSIDANAEVIKTAHEQGVEDAERVVKVANAAGDIMGKAALETICEGVHDYIARSFGFDPEGVAKTASLADIMDAAALMSFEKIAETYSSQTGGANLVSTQMAGMDQLREEGKAHAVLAVQAANDALASVDMGDANTAAQSIATAGQNITLAQQAAAAVPDEELAAQVAEASAIVSQAASAMQQQVGAPTPVAAPAAPAAEGPVQVA